MRPPPPGATRRLVCETSAVRLDRLISEQWGPLTRRRTRAIIAAGAVRVNGHVARKGLALRAGDVVEVDAAALSDQVPRGEAGLAVGVLVEDAAVLAIDKPAGMASVALDGETLGSVANVLLGRAPETAAAGRTPLEAGLVHRLDTGTSGVLLAARSATAWTALREQFRARQVDKRYVAWVEGALTRSGAIDIPIAHHPRRPRVMQVCADPARARALGARAARTTYRPLSRRGDATLIEVTIDAGVRHQVRAHLAALGHPVRGDILYGAGAAPRLLLHAAALRVRHPLDGRWLTIESPLPEAFSRG